MQRKINSAALEANASQQNFNIPHVVTRILPPVVIPAPCVDGNCAFITVSRQVGDGDIAFVVRAKFMYEIIECQILGNYHSMGLLHAVDPVVNLCTLNYLLHGLQRYGWRPETEYTHWHSLWDALGLSEHINCSDSTSESFRRCVATHVVKYCVTPFGVRLGKNCVDFATSLVIDGQVSNLTDIWTKKDTFETSAGDDLILILEETETNEYTLCPLAKDVCTKKFAPEQCQVNTLQRLSAKRARTTCKNFQLVPAVASEDTVRVQHAVWYTGYWHIARTFSTDVNSLISGTLAPMWMNALCADPRERSRVKLLQEQRLKSREFVALYNKTYGDTMKWSTDVVSVVAAVCTMAEAGKFSSDFDTFKLQHGASAMFHPSPEHSSFTPILSQAAIDSLSEFLACLEQAKTDWHLLITQCQNKYRKAVAYEFKEWVDHVWPCIIREADANDVTGHAAACIWQSISDEILPKGTLLDRQAAIEASVLDNVELQQLVTPNAGGVWHVYRAPRYISEVLQSLQVETARYSIHAIVVKDLWDECAKEAEFIYRLKERYIQMFEFDGYVNNRELRPQLLQWEQSMNECLYKEELWKPHTGHRLRALTVGLDDRFRHTKTILDHMQHTEYAHAASGTNAAEIHMLQLRVKRAWQPDAGPYTFQHGYKFNDELFRYTLNHITQLIAKRKDIVICAKSQALTLLFETLLTSLITVDTLTTNYIDQCELDDFIHNSAIEGMTRQLASAVYTPILQLVPAMQSDELDKLRDKVTLLVHTLTVSFNGIETTPITHPVACRALYRSIQQAEEAYTKQRQTDEMACIRCLKDVNPEYAAFIQLYAQAGEVFANILKDIRTRMNGGVADEIYLQQLNTDLQEHLKTHMEYLVQLKASWVKL